MSPAGETTTFGEAYHWGDNYLTAGIHDRHPAPESGGVARLRHERYLNGQTWDAGHHQLPRHSARDRC